MRVNVSELERGYPHQTAGSFDITEVNQIETKFAAYCSGEKLSVIVDLSGVEYLASIGIRLLVINAKSLKTRNGRMVLLSPTTDVMSVLEITDIPAIIPVYAQAGCPEAVLLGR